MKLCSPEDCTGCYACFNACNHQAIEMIKNHEGFFYPSINNDKCTECGLCEKKCPVLHPVIRSSDFEQYGYACWSNDKNIRRKSSSGGFFSEAANVILKQGGVVVGAGFDKNFVLKHSMIDQAEDLESLRGSKYVQSQMNDIFYNIKHHLKENRTVLFTGTPCQVAGLYSYLGKREEHLYTLDLICHGVPSGAVFDKYKKWLEEKHQAKLTDYQFRDKRRSWMWYNIKARFSSGDTYIGGWFNDPFLRIFLRDNVLRECCYSCKYANMNRIGDITIADYWGFKTKNNKDKNTDEGISLALINNLKGEALFERCKTSLTFFRREKGEISKSQKNLSSSLEHATFSYCILE
ncbi:MAG: Coenzyme F420 hydrogenase/dehydrogenase, beta subunit C-terminal domain [Paludibacteraceae bacterium]